MNKQNRNNNLPQIALKLFEIEFDAEAPSVFFNTLYRELSEHIAIEAFALYKCKPSVDEVETYLEINLPNDSAVSHFLELDFESNVLFSDNIRHKLEGSSFLNQFASFAVMKIDWAAEDSIIYALIVKNNDKNYSEAEKNIYSFIHKLLYTKINNSNSGQEIKYRIEELMEFVSDIVIIIDNNSNIVFCNQIAKDKLLLSDEGQYRIDDIISDTDLINTFLKANTLNSKEIYLDFSSIHRKQYPVRLLLSKIKLLNQEFVLLLAKDLNEEFYFRDAEIIIERNSQLFRNVSEFMLLLLDAKDINQSIKNFIPKLRKLIQANCVFLASYSTQFLEYNFELSQYLTDEFEQFEYNLPEQFLISEDSDILNRLKRNQTISINYDDKTLSQEIGFIATEYQSITLSPILINDDLYGVIAAIHDNDISNWKDNELHSLSIVGNAIGIAIDKKNNLRDMIIARESAEYAFRAKTDFLSCMSHEVRTPLNAIIGMSELLNMTVEDEEQLEFVSTIFNSANQLTNIVNDVLDLSSIDTGSFILDKKLFNFRDFIKKLIYTMSYDAFNKGIHFIIDLDNNIPIEIIGDPSRIKQIFVNLIGNAIKYTSQGEILIKIKIIEEQSSYIRLQASITDTGVGITNEKLSVIFDTFGKADYSTSKTNRGTGLGLTMAKKMVEMMDGAISVTSMLNFGSTFTFDIRLFRAEKELFYQTPTPPADNYFAIIENNSSTMQVLNSYIQKLSKNIINISTYDKVLNTIEQNIISGKVFSHIIIGQEDSNTESVFNLIKAIKSSSLIPRECRIVLLSIGDFSTLDQFFLSNNEISCIHKPAFPEDIYNFLDTF